MERWEGCFCPSAKASTAHVFPSTNQASLIDAAHRDWEELDYLQIILPPDNKADQLKIHELITCIAARPPDNSIRQLWGMRGWGEGWPHGLENDHLSDEGACSVNHHAATFAQNNCW